MLEKIHKFFLRWRSPSLLASGLVLATHLIDYEPTGITIPLLPELFAEQRFGFMEAVDFYAAAILWIVLLGALVKISTLPHHSDEISFRFVILDISAFIIAILIPPAYAWIDCCVNERPRMEVVELFTSKKIAVSGTDYPHKLPDRLRQFSRGGGVRLNSEYGHPASVDPAHIHVRFGVYRRDSLEYSADDLPPKGMDGDGDCFHIRPHWYYVQTNYLQDMP